MVVWVFSTITLAHSGLVTPYGDIDLLVDADSGNGLLPDNTKPLPETMLIYHQWVLWHSYEINFSGNTHDINLWDQFENYIFNITGTYPRGQRVDPHLC